MWTFLIVILVLAGLKVAFESREYKLLREGWRPQLAQHYDTQGNPTHKTVLWVKVDNRVEPGKEIY